MGKVTVELPRLLVDVVGEERLQVEATTLRGALEALTSREPRLGPLLFDEAGAFREHVLCFHNGTNTRWLESLDQELADGDTLAFMQCVSRACANYDSTSIHDQSGEG